MTRELRAESDKKLLDVDDRKGNQDYCDSPANPEGCWGSTQYANDHGLLSFCFLYPFGLNSNTAPNRL